VKLHALMTTPELAGAEFSAPSWSTWRIIARLIDGDAHLLSSEEQAAALQLTGRTALPTTAPREVYVGAGRRSGKSRFGALVAVWPAAQEYPQLAAGENAVVVDVAPDRKQATIDLDYSRGLVDGSALLWSELANATQDTLAFKHRTQLEVARRYCMDAAVARAAEFAAMTPQLTDYELETVARACRALAHVERESAEKISDPSLRARVQKRAQCAAALAEKFEAARNSRDA
jgi:hypothetical protein